MKLADKFPFDNRDYREYEGWVDLIDHAYNIQMIALEMLNDFDEDTTRTRNAISSGTHEMLKLFYAAKKQQVH